MLKVIIIFSVTAINTPGAVSSYGIPKNNNCSASNTNSIQSSTGNKADTASNVPLTTGNERPVSLELQPALPYQESAQVSIP